MASNPEGHPVVTVAQLNGPLWAVSGKTLEVPAGSEPSQFLIDHLDVYSNHVGRRELDVRPSGRASFTLILGQDGAVTASSVADPGVLGWLRPAQRTISTAAAAAPASSANAAAVSAGWPVYGAHHGAGATTWAELVAGTEIVNPDDYPGPLLVVARTTLQGVEAAKTLTRRAGAVLMVADAPGSLPADVRRGIRVLSGAAPVVRVPWVPALRGTLTISHTPAVAKAAAKIVATIRNNWKETS